MSHLNVIARDLNVPQNQKMNERQVENNAGGFVYKTSDLSRLERFIVLGSDGGTYYTSEKELTLDNARHALDMISRDGLSVVRVVVEISLAGRAPKQDTGIFVLALCAAYGNEATRAAALAALPRVCRTHRMLFTFLNFVEQHRGWGRGLRKAVANWYLSKDVEQMAFQMLKYRQGQFPRKSGQDRVWNARNILRVSHPVVDGDDHARRALIDWAKGKPDMIAVASHDSLALVAAFEEAWNGDVSAARKIELCGMLTHEMIPDAWKRDRNVWEALLANMLPEAMLRNLAVMTRVGLLEPRSAAAKLAAERLTNAELVRSKRLHPAKFLTALGIYSAGGEGGRSKAAPFIPVPEIVEALDAGFYLAFPNVEPAGKRNFIGLDVSGSMSSPSAAFGVTCKDAAAAIALVQVATEPHVEMYGFSAAGSGRAYGGRFGGGESGMTPIPAKAGHRIADVKRLMDKIPMGGTDCSLPMLYALKHDLKVDTFQIYTDNETWAGSVHPMKALQMYRDKSGIPAKLVVCALTATGFSIADPEDAGSLDVVGFDANVPVLISDFSRGATAPENPIKRN